MITLPNIALTTKTTGTAETSGTTDLLSGGEALPKDFITTLGNQLLSWRNCTVKPRLQQKK